MMPMLTEIIARFVTDTPDAALPAGALAAARDALVDTVACGLAGTQDEASRIAEAWVASEGGRGVCRVWGSSLSASAADAAFANAIRAHVLDYDDSALHLRGHPSAVMMAAALAVAESTGASGRAMLTAYAIGLEVGTKLSPALGPGHYFKGWHTTATVGIFAATAIAARLYGLDALQAQHALGLAASQAAGLTQNFGSMTKSFHVGHAAACGIRSAWLAQRGFTANPAVFDGNKSFITLYAGERARPLEESGTRLGQPWELHAPGLYRKRFPCCYAVHRAMAGLLELLQRDGIATADVEEIVIGYLPGVQHPLIHRNPVTGLEAKFSTEYCMAAMALDRKVDIASFDDAAVMRPAIRALMAKVRTYEIPDPNVYNGLTGYNQIAVVARGRKHELRIDRTPGSPDWPLVGEELAAKFLACARTILPEDRARSALRLASTADTLTDVRTLTAAFAAA